MGIDLIGLKFIKFASNKKSLGNVATIGRQKLLFTKKELNRLINENSDFMEGDYCENFLKKAFNVKAVDSFDNSDFEGATHIIDMNLPLQKKFQYYDTIIDFGSLEHIFNVAQSLANVSNLCKQNGQILHYLPANNNCGHGFWQFSPEVFFSLYSEKNGYKNTEIFVINVHNNSNWWKVHKQKQGERIELNSNVPLYLAVRTEKVTEKTSQIVQQSDYLELWNKKDNSENKTINKSKFSIFIKYIKDQLKLFLRNNIITKKIYQDYEAVNLTNKNDYKRNKYLEKFDI